MGLFSPSPSEQLDQLKNAIHAGRVFVTASPTGATLRFSVPSEDAMTPPIIISEQTARELLSGLQQYFEAKDGE